MTMSRQGGVALLMVLLCLALSGLLLAGLAEEGRRDLRRLSLLQAETQARFHARGAELLVERALTDPAARLAPAWWRRLAGEPQRLETPEGHVEVRIRDLRTCFNLNSLAGPDAALAERQLQRVLRGSAERGLTPHRLVARLADWVDADSQPRPDSLDGLDYALLDPPRTTADAPLVDLSELNWLAPLDPERYRRHPSLCVMPDTGPWRLNLNSLREDQLPMLEALLEDRVPGPQLARLIAARPPAGYTGIDEVQAVLGNQADWLRELGNRMTLAPDYLELGITVSIGDTPYRFQRLLQAEGVSNWSPRVAAARVRTLARRSEGMIPTTAETGQTRPEDETP